MWTFTEVQIDGTASSTSSSWKDGELQGAKDDIDFVYHPKSRPNHHCDSLWTGNTLCWGPQRNQHSILCKYYVYFISQAQVLVITGGANGWIMNYEFETLTIL
jgi:hypothetical protein